MNSGMVLCTVLGLLLLVIPAGLLYLMDRKLLRTFGIAFGQMLLQMAVLGLIVWGVVHVDRWWVNLFWLALMAVWSAWVVSKKTHLDLRKVLMPVCGGLLAGTLLVGMYLLFLVLGYHKPMSAVWFVPLMGLLLGHSLTMNIRGLSAYHSALQADEQQYEYLRGNGMSHLQAVMPFLRRAFQALLAPTASNLAVMGRYTMPLLLCGIMMDGCPPVFAFLATILLTVGCIASSVISLAVTLWLADRQLFDKFGKLK